MLPPVALFLGPRSVGKWATAEYLRWKNKISVTDTLRIHKLTAELARSFVQFCQIAPATREGKMAIIQMDKASPSSVHILLKALEDLPSCIKVILIAEKPPLETVVSRTQTFSFGLLSEDAVAQILIEKHKIEAGEAVRLAGLSGGQVYRSLAAVDVDDTQEVVLAVLAAFREKNPAALDRLAAKWTDEATELLTVWCNEAITHRWRSYSPSEAVTGTSLPLKILLSLHTNIRPRLVVRSSLMSVLQGAS